MQQQEQPVVEISRSKMITTSIIKKIAENIKGADPININAFIVILISGIGELLGLSLEWPWYVMVFAIITIFALDKLNILNRHKENGGVIISGDKPNKLNE